MKKLGTATDPQSDPFTVVKIPRPSRKGNWEVAAVGPGSLRARPDVCSAEPFRAIPRAAGWGGWDWSRPGVIGQGPGFHENLPPVVALRLSFQNRQRDFKDLVRRHVFSEMNFCFFLN